MLGVMDILGDAYRRTVLFFLGMNSLGLHDNNSHCEVITIQNSFNALVSCQIFLLTDHAVGIEITAFGICEVRVLLPFYIYFDTRNSSCSP